MQSNGMVPEDIETVRYVFSKKFKIIFVNYYKIYSTMLISLVLHLQNKNTFYHIY